MGLPADPTGWGRADGDVGLLGLGETMCVCVFVCVCVCVCECMCVCVCVCVRAHFKFSHLANIHFLRFYQSMVSSIIQPVGIFYLPAS